MEGFFVLDSGIGQIKETDLLNYDTITSLRLSYPVLGNLPLYRLIDKWISRSSHIQRRKH